MNLSESPALNRLLDHPALARATGLEVGVATSSFQAEGGLNGPGEPRTHWARWEASGRVERSGPACGLWKRYPEVVARALSLGITHVRVSLEWARLAPSGEAIDPRAAEAYASRLALLTAAGITPVVTLSHFTHPLWAGEDFWLDARSPAVFARYAVAAAKAVGVGMVRRGQPPLGRVLTLNEPNMLALATYVAGVFPHGAGAVAEGDPLGFPRALRALDHLMAAHVRAHRGLHGLHTAMGWPAPDVSTNVNFVDVYGVGKGLFDLLRAPSLGVRPRALGDFMKRCETRFLADLFVGESEAPRARAARAVQGLVGRVVSPELFEQSLGLLYEGVDPPPVDHLAIDLYDPFTLHQLPGSEALFDALAAGRALTEIAALARGGLRMAEPWEWRSEPGTLVRALRAMTFPDPPLPIDIDENGMAIQRPHGSAAHPREDGVTRTSFLRGYLTALLEARVTHGLPVRAWLYWTLVDNYELARWSPRFGLYGLPDPAHHHHRHRAPPWSHLDAAGEDAAAVLGAFARALAAGRSDPAALRPSLAAALAG